MAGGLKDKSSNLDAGVAPRLDFASQAPLPLPLHTKSPANPNAGHRERLRARFAGQPELDEMLDSFELRQIKQRIALRCHLEPLNLEETRGYIQRRLQIAGVPPEIALFSEPALEAVFRHSNGFPRLINTICENALLAGYARRAAVIPPDVIEEIAHDLRLGVVVTRGAKKNGQAMTAADPAKLPSKEQEKDELLRAVTAEEDRQGSLLGGNSTRPSRKTSNSPSSAKSLASIAPRWSASTRGSSLASPSPSPHATGTCPTPMSPSTSRGRTPSRGPTVLAPSS